MATLNTPGPTIATDTIDSTTVTIQFTDPPGVTVSQNWVAWAEAGGTVTLSGPADAQNEVDIVVTADTFIIAVGFSYDVGGDIYGPGPPIAFSAPYDAFPQFEANNDSIQSIVNKLSTKVSIDDFEYYAGILDGRVTDLKENHKSLTTRMGELLATVQAALRKLLNP